MTAAAAAMNVNQTSVAPFPGAVAGSRLTCVWRLESPRDGDASPWHEWRGVVAARMETGELAVTWEQDEGRIVVFPPPNPPDWVFKVDWTRSECRPPIPQVQWMGPTSGPGFQLASVGDRRQRDGTRCDVGGASNQGGTMFPDPFQWTSQTSFVAPASQFQQLPQQLNQQQPLFPPGLPSPYATYPQNFSQMWADHAGGLDPGQAQILASIGADQSRRSMEQLKHKFLGQSCTIPGVISESHQVFYPAHWLEMMFGPSGTVTPSSRQQAIDGWSMAFQAKLLSLKPQPIPLVKSLLDSMRLAVIAYLRTVQRLPQTSEEWSVLLLLLRQIFFQCVTVEYDANGFETIVNKVLASPGIVNYANALAGVARRK